MINLFVVVTLINMTGAVSGERTRDVFSGMGGYIQKLELDYRLKHFSENSQKYNKNEIHYKWFDRVEGKSFTTNKAQNYYRSIPIVGGLTLVHQDFLKTEIEQTQNDFVISTQAKLSPQEAIKISRALSENKLQKLPELKVLPSLDRNSATLVYFVDTKSEGLNPGVTVVVDANTGAILAEMSKAHTIANVDIHTAKGQGFSIKEIFEKKPNPVTNIPKDEFKGCELKDIKTGKIQKLTAQECVWTMYGYTSVATDSCQVLFESDGSPIFINPLKCDAVIQASKEVSEPSAAVKRAFENSQKTLKYYLDTFNRNSFDNQGTVAKSVVEVGINFANAAWFSDQDFMIYGTGDSDFADFTSVLDVAGHELTHGVVSKTANLMMMDEPGALNEAVADYFGKMIANDGNWRVGEGIFLNDPSDAIRDLKNPASLKTVYLNEKGERVLVPYPSKYSEKLKSFEKCAERNDRCYVHANSTIMGHAFYRIQEKLGKTKAENIIYTALTQFFTENSNFKEASEGLKKACDKLYGESDCTSVKELLKELGLLV